MGGELREKMAAGGNLCKIVGKNLQHLSSALFGKMCNHVQDFFFSCIVDSDQTTGKSNEAARARMLLQVVANRRKSWGHLSVTVDESRGSLQPKALTLSVQGVGLISLNRIWE